MPKRLNIFKSVKFNKELNCGRKTVTQQSNLTNQVEINSASGKIVTFPTDFNSGETVTFTVYNKRVDANSVILLTGGMDSQNIVYNLYVQNVRKHYFDISYVYIGAPGAPTTSNITINFLVC